MLMKGPLEELAKSYKNSADENFDKKLSMILRNSNKLDNLINQLLELSQLESASIPVKAARSNIVTTLKGLTAAFDSLAGQKNIRLVVSFPEEPPAVWFDKDKLEKILNNLLSNAFKFTPAGGVIEVSLSNNIRTEKLELRIKDTGIGIPTDKVDKIFNRFYQVDDSNSRAFGGSGIGLALVKELVELHKWEIKVESHPGAGAEFTLLIPAGDYLSEKDKVTESEACMGKADMDVRKSVLPGKISEADFRNNIAGLSTRGERAPVTILLVEDSSDVREYLTGIISTWINLLNDPSIPWEQGNGVQPRIIESENGKSGLQAAFENLPDLIISDVMMPYMDGIEFCKQIKTRWETSSIPVILLTAKASDQSKLEGLENGADEYLTKPFDSKELYIRARNLLMQRRMLKERFSGEIKINLEAANIIPGEDEFLSKALKIVELNLSNSDFGLEAFAAQMFLSRSQLHRKLTSSAGISPGEFLRICRLKHAAKLILEKNLSITQVCFEAGYTSPSHFTKAFTQQFSCPPSEFASKVKSQQV